MKINNYVTLLVAFIWMVGVTSQSTSPSSEVTRPPRSNREGTASTLRRLRQINRHHRRRQGNRRRHGRRRMRNQTTTEKSGPNSPEATVIPTISREQYENRIRKKHARIFIIQQNILSQLGLHKQPNVTRPRLSPEAEQQMLLYYRGKKEEAQSGEIQTNTDQEFYASMESPHPSCQKPPRWDNTKWRSNIGYRLYFDIRSTSNNRKTRVASAFLKIYKKKVLENEVTGTTDPATTPVTIQQVTASRTLRRSGRGVTVQADVEDLGMENVADSSRIRISVLQYLRPVRRRGTVRKKLLDSVMVSKSYQGHLKLDLREAATEWLKRPQKNFGVELEVEDSLQNKMDPTLLFDGHECSGQNETSTTESSGVENYTDPTLLLTTEVPVDAATRAKRGAKIAMASTCKADTMTIDFREIGWSDWVLQPNGFTTKYCHGECPGRPLDNTFVLPGMTCCSPTKTKSLSLLYVDQYSRIVLALMENVIVTECGCRT